MDTEYNNITIDKNANLLFKNYYDQLKDHVGEKTTFTSDLEKYGKKALGNNFMGVFAYDQIPKVIGRYKCFIFNLDKSTEKKREHWVCIYKYQHDKLLFYDSFGRSHTKILRNLKNIYDEKIEDAQKDPEQKIDETNCGLNCLAWLCVCVYNGAKYAKYI